MIYLIVLVLCGLFIAFFALLELWYLGIFPFLFLVLFFSQSFVDMRMTFQGTDFIKKYGLYGFSLLVFFGLLGMLEFFGFTYQNSFFILLFLCWIARYASYFFDYEDGKNLFFHGFLFILAIILGNSYIIEGIPGISSTSILVLGLAILGFGGLYYGIGMYREVKKDYLYYFLFTIILFFLDVVYLNIFNSLYALDIDLLLYLLLMSILSYYLTNHTEKDVPLRREISLRRVLAGERVLEARKREAQTPLSEKISSFVYNTPTSIKYLLEYINVFLLLGVLCAYLTPIFQGNTLPQLRYWCGIVFFLINAFLLKKYWIFTMVTRFAVVIIVNFSLYISLLTFGESITDMIPWLIAWNILCGLLIFYTKLPGVRAYIKQSDIAFWLVTCLVAMLLNIVLLLRLDSLSGQIIFSLVFLYLGIRGWISYYVIQLIKGFPTLIEVQETEETTDSDL